MKKVIIVSAMALIAIGVVVTVAPAAGGNHWFWGTTQARGQTATFILETTSPGTSNDEVLAYVDPTLGGFVTDGSPADSRAEILLNRTGSGGTGNAWIKSSSDAKVLVETTGDVIITLGN